MTLDEAIQTALDYETRVRDTYLSAIETVSDPIGIRLFQALAEDEQYHLDYLNKKLSEWTSTGTLTIDKLTSSLPAVGEIAQYVEKLKTRMAEEDRGDEKQMLSKALAVEAETFNFYQKMVDELPDEGKALFSQFLVIEKGHIAAVQAELDHLSSTGYWFEWKEFDME
jgi:rubrerythrin